jgi:alcohol dehydrogenase class IV
MLPWRQPELIKGEDCFDKMIAIIKDSGINSVLLVTDGNLTKLGLHKGILEAGEKAGVKIAVYDKTVPNPTIDNIEASLAMYKENNCGAIITLGGGSSMDCAKVTGARVANPNKTVKHMKGVLKVGKKLPLLFAIPTTAGTGSETTLAAVICDAQTHEKFVLNDPVLIPRYAILNPSLTTGLPKHITSTTGMDALTHAVEAYIGKSTTKQTRAMSEDAVRLIFKYLKTAYDDGKNIEARENMLLASYEAGVAFTRAYVGYVHSLAHALGGMYGTPHGLANAVILPYVLDYFGESVYKPLAKLADCAGITKDGETDEQKAKSFMLLLKK